MSLDSLLKKYSVYVLLALIGATAYFQAAGAMQLIGSALLVPRRRKVALLPNATVAGAVPSASPKDAEPILARNAFDSATGPLNEKPDAGTSEKNPMLDLSDPLVAQDCEGIHADIITESTDPSWSVAALTGKGESAPKLRRVGDEVSGLKVAYIGYNLSEESPAVWLTSDAELCEVLLFQRADAGTPPPAQKLVAARSPPGRGAPKLPDDIKNKIKKISDTEFEVDRSVVDAVLSNQAQLMRSARIIPETKNGQVVGVRLFGIRPDTLLGTLGIQNGDRLETINGFSMSSPEKALEAYTRLRAAEGLTLQVDRRGQPTTIEIKFK